MYISDESKIVEFVKSSIEYLKSLKNQDFKPITNSKRKTGFNGLITYLNSVYNLFNDTVKTGTMDFILTYKVSQDHLEMLFSVIRSRGGFNNNPFAAQFEATYKKLLIHTVILTYQFQTMQIAHPRTQQIFFMFQVIKRNQLKIFWICYV